MIFLWFSYGFPIKSPRIIFLDLPLPLHPGRCRPRYPALRRRPFSGPIAHSGWRRHIPPGQPRLRSRHSLPLGSPVGLYLGTSGTAGTRVWYAIVTRGVADVQTGLLRRVGIRPTRRSAWPPWTQTPPSRSASARGADQSNRPEHRGCARPGK